MKAIDLHVHSTYSDGTVPPADLVKQANDLGLNAMALTDHDTLDGIGEARAAADGTPLEFIPGIELSCSYHDFKEIHIVGLYVNPNDEFNDCLVKLKKSREERNLKVVEKFSQLGINFTLEDIRRKYPNATLTRMHFADYLHSNGYVSSRSEAFDRYLNDHGPCFIPRKYLSPERAIELIRGAGGVPVLAHPVLYHLSDDVMEQMLKELKDLGLSAMECIYSTYTMGDELLMRKFAKKYDLLPSGGSDYHGDNKPTISLGTGKGHLFVPADILEPIRMLADDSKQ
jgi:hypothetical protein